MSKKYLLGVDGGTEGLRAGIFDISGTPLAYASTTYTTQFTAPSWAEQDPTTGGMLSASQSGKFVRCFLKGEIGDQINISISSVAYNLKMDPVQAGIIFNLFYTSLKNMICRKINYFPVYFLS